MVLMVLIDVRVIWILRDERDEVVLHESILAQQATHFLCLSHPPALHNNGKKQKQQQQSVAAAGNSLDQQSQRCSHVLGVLPPTAPCWLAVVVQLLHPGTQAGKAHTQRHMSAKQPTHTHMHAHTHTHACTHPHTHKASPLHDTLQLQLVPHCLSRLKLLPLAHLCGSLPQLRAIHRTVSWVAYTC